jgi:hypothetical protein
LPCSLSRPHLAAEAFSERPRRRSRYVEEAGSTLGATIVHAMWQAALKDGCVISTDATSTLPQPEKSKDGQR